MAVVDGTESILDGQKEWQPVATATAKGSEAEKRAESDQIAELQRLIEFRIGESTRAAGSPMPPEIASQIQSMKAAIAGANLTTLALVFVQTSNIKIDIAEAQAESAAYLNSIAHISSMYPGYGEYSRAGQRFIARELAEAFERSPELRDLRERYEAMPQVERESAEAEQRKNQETIREMLADPSRKDVHEHLRIMRGTGMANGADAQELLTKLKNGEITADEFKEKVAEGVAKIAAKNDEFINKYIEKNVPEHSREAILADERLTTNGKVDSVKLYMEWGKIKLADKDAAYKALAEAGGDISKLNPDQQRIVHMAQVMVAAETKATIQGALDIVARNHDMAKQLTDPNLSVEEKVALLVEQEKRQGTYQPNSFHMQALKQSVIAINETVQEGGTLDPTKPADFLKKVGANVQENYNELLNKKPAQTSGTQANVEQVSYGYQGFVYYASVANSDYTVSWKSAEQQAADKASWQAIEDKLALAYTPEAQAAGTSSATPTVKTEAEMAADAAILATNPVKAYYDQLAAEQKAAAEKAGAAPVAAASEATPATASGAPANQTAAASEAAPVTPAATPVPASTITLPAGIEIPPLKGVSSVAAVATGELPVGHLVVTAKTAQEAISQGA